MTIRACDRGALLAASILLGRGGDRRPLSRSAHRHAGRRGAGNRAVPTPRRRAPATPPRRAVPTLRRPRARCESSTPPASRSKSSGTENPYASTVDAPAALPPKLAFAGQRRSAVFFVSIHVDSTGKAAPGARDRDPIPSLAGETLRSISPLDVRPGASRRATGRHLGAFASTFTPRSARRRSCRCPSRHHADDADPPPFQWLPECDWFVQPPPREPYDGSVPIVDVTRRRSRRRLPGRRTPTRGRSR